MTEYNPELENAINHLVQQLNNSKEYQRYLKVREVVRSDDVLKEKVSRIRYLSQKLQRHEDDDSVPDEYEQIENEYEELAEDGRVHDFIQAETDFVRQFQDVYTRVVSKIDFDI